MSLHVYAQYQVPAETARVAQAAFPKGNLYLRVFDEIGRFYTDQQFSALFAGRGQPGYSPFRLALTTLLQFNEDLSDRQAADMVRSRLDWKYVLCLELTDSGFDYSLLSEFRRRLVEGQQEAVLFETLLEVFRQHGLLKAGGRQRTDSTHVLAAVRTLNRLERVGETLRQALNVLATVVPDWLRPQVLDEWWLRYSTPVDNYKLPKAEAERLALAAQIGEDGFKLLSLVKQAEEYPWLAQIPALEILSKVWQEQYTREPDQLDGYVRLKEVKELPTSADQISSPVDPEARYSIKRGLEWVGYKVHLTETCESDSPHLITQVETTVATTPDEAMTLSIEEQLAAKQLLPDVHILDAGYTNTEVLVKSAKEYGLEIIGPVAVDGSWQAKAGQGFDKSHFLVDWEAKKVICPAGKISQHWHYTQQPSRKESPIQVSFAQSDCNNCQWRAACTASKTGPRALALQEREQHQTMQKARRQQATPEFKARYAVRAGVEGTISQAVRSEDIRHARYLGLAKTHLQQLCSAAGLNLRRVGEWLAGTPFAKTRYSAFARLRLAG
jgi:transposase